MKKQISIILAITLLLTMFSACENTKPDFSSSSITTDTTTATNVKKEATILQNNPIRKSVFNSFFLNNKMDFSNVSRVTIEINDDIWVINGKEYYSNSTTYHWGSNDSFWSINLQRMKPCGKSDEVLLYSYDGKCDNDILMADYANNSYFLSHGDVLDPYQYEFSDFGFEYQKKDYKTIEEINTEDLWAVHLNGKGISVNTKNNELIVRFHLKCRPELIYTVHFTNGDGVYTSSEPFKPTVVPAQKNQKQTIPTPEDTIENEIVNYYGYSTHTSVFDKNIPSFDFSDVATSVIKTDGDIWTIDGKKYFSNKIVSRALVVPGSWRVDLSYMKPCGKNDKVLLYSADGRSDNDIIVAEYANNLYFLSSGDILDPYNYSVSDFSFELWEDYLKEYESVTYEELWNAHLNLESFSSSSTDAGGCPSIRMRLKNKPELIYSFSFNVSEDKIYNYSSPFEPTIAE